MRKNNILYSAVVSVFYAFFFSGSIALGNSNVGIGDAPYHQTVPFGTDLISASVQWRYNNLVLEAGLSLLNKCSTFSLFLIPLPQNPIEIGISYKTGKYKIEALDVITVHSILFSTAAECTLNDKFAIGTKINIGNSFIAISETSKNFLSYGAFVTFSYKVSENVTFFLEAGYNNVHNNGLLGENLKVVSKLVGADMHICAKFTF
ncbi:hypothetical protein Cyrtocomes_01136 [Candidatus Cyrtobacter comes]|uniref:Outer membrane protein beta-barrel domain-containing protein n=1 Tax=Candidatus Cyrtobacter comes TaxID=675776 RepID=A0ABU5L9M2_9RICK|nr:hypothetical protein [Candidatus Cyrtobacter comes]MDZ5762742.1 hypothetical protein [Candidatus Cyrtobacter comes]